MPRKRDNPTRQSGAVPYRHCGDTVEFCLITSSRGRRWGFPKGYIDPGEAAGEAALKEAFEEAGLHGGLDDQPLGDYCYRKMGQNLSVTFYLMRVEAADDQWPEASIRRRRWCSARQAMKLLARAEHRGLLAAALDRTKRNAKAAAPTTC